MLGTADFYSTSACRDLVFRPQEHRLTLPDLQAFIAGNRLEFLGFETSSHVRSEFAKRFPQERALTDLANWHAFEKDNPDTFLDMYNFWVRKPERL